MATLTQIHTRLVEFCGAINGITTALKDYPEDRLFGNTALPALVVEITDAPARREQTGAGLYFVTRRFRLFLAVAETDRNVTVPGETTLTTCEVLFEAIAQAFARNPRLGCTVIELQGDPPAPVSVRRADLVYGTSLPSDTGISAYDVDRVRYWGTIFTIDVTDEMNY